MVSKLAWNLGQTFIQATLFQDVLCTDHQCDTVAGEAVGQQLGELAVSVGDVDTCTQHGHNQRQSVTGPTFVCLLLGAQLCYAVACKRRCLVQRQCLYHELT